MLKNIGTNDKVKMIFGKPPCIDKRCTEKFKKDDANYIPVPPVKLYKKFSFNECKLFLISMPEDN